MARPSAACSLSRCQPGAAFMLALKPDMVRIELGGFEYSASKVLIGLDGGTLSGDRAYRAIIHPALTEGEGTTKMDANSNKPVSDGSCKSEVDASSLNGEPVRNQVQPRTQDDNHEAIFIVFEFAINTADS